MADANGLMRLMTAEKGQESPMEKYIRFKNNIELWYEEMDEYGLTKNEQEILKPYFLKSHGVPPSQEQMMMMLMDPNICEFSLADANAARKIVGKKQMSKIPELREKVHKQAKSQALGNYVWNCGIGPQMRVLVLHHPCFGVQFHRVSNNVYSNQLESNILEYRMFSCK